MSTVSINHPIQLVGNKLLEWQQQERSCCVRYGLTRVGAIALGALEAISFSFQPLVFAGRMACAMAKIPVRLAVLIFPSSERLKRLDDYLPSFWDAMKTVGLLCRIATAFASTVVFGLFLSPSLNYRIHTSKCMQLIDDDQARARLAELRKQSVEQAQREALMPIVSPGKCCSKVPENYSTFMRLAGEIEPCLSSTLSTLA